MEVLAAFLPLLVPIALLAIGGLVGAGRERAHLADLAQREQALSPMITVDVRALPAGSPVGAGGQLVIGNVVIASDYFKSVSAQLRNLVGGEVRSLTPLLDRGRREARLRMVEQARQAGADVVINVRFETSTIGAGSAEVICYGTALRTGR